MIWSSLKSKKTRLSQPLRDLGVWQSRLRASSMPQLSQMNQLIKRMGLNSREHRNLFQVDLRIRKNLLSLTSKSSTQMTRTSLVQPKSTSQWAAKLMKAQRRVSSAPLKSTSTTNRTPSSSPLCSSCTGQCKEACHSNFLSMGSLSMLQTPAKPNSLFSSASSISNSSWPI